MRGWMSIAYLAKPKNLNGGLVARGASGLPFVLHPGLTLAVVPPQLDAPRTLTVREVTERAENEALVFFDEVSDLSGAELLAGCELLAREEGIDAMLYSHPCNMYGHGPGPTIGLWSNQGPIPVAGGVRVDENTCWALELNVKAPAQGRDKCFIYTEETIMLDSEGVHYLHEGRDKITFIG